jgi:hypothetical protein
MADDASQPPRRAKGNRPYYFDDPAIDQLHAAFLALAAEVSVAYERIDTLERLLERTGTVSRKDVEGFRPEPEAAAERDARRGAMIERLMQPFREYREHLFAKAQHAKSRGEGDSAS